MRRKRSKKKKKITSKVLYLTTIGLFTMGITGSTQYPSSYSLFTDSTQISTDFISTAFVFPNTVQEIARKVELAKQKIKQYDQEANQAYKQCENEDLEEAKIHAEIIFDLEISVQKQRLEAENDFKELENYFLIAEEELQFAQLYLKEMIKQENPDQKLVDEAHREVQSAQQIYAYIISPYKQAIKDLEQVSILVNQFNEVMNQAKQCIENKDTSVTEEVYGQNDSVTEEVYDEP